MGDFPFSFGVNQFTTQPWSFEEDVARYAELGVDAIEVCEAKLAPEKLQAQLDLVKQSGLKISAVQPKIRTFFGSKMAPEPTETDARVEAFIGSLKKLAPYAQGASFVMNTGAPVNGNVRQVVDETVRYMRKVAPIAQDLGVKVAIEPLNPTSVNVETAIWTIDQALELIETVAHPAFGLCLDYWNIWQQNQCAEAIKRAGKAIFVLQVSDWRTPYSGTDRLVPGDGSIPLGQLLRATHDAGFDGACTVEIFSSDVPDSLYDQDLKTVLVRSRDGLIKAWNEG
ncbi:4-hydroxyphenylpyruvate dioxygenase [Neokomagataea thailandica NBRC 106555]|uniref:Sugar phosphate isomerase/epimerase n=2 Tax=Neokomagataea TaxID=1223423 RepID=A0A4Y6V9G1_9PROT|nr:MULTISPECIES: sugar phosphate isomerase/epimerase family protein [Neokomagataea]QDH25136.1 sugar phosphate isomerase/epimerase [Neokomagataea tanensis]GBR52051.1 4-hydroxyphenylpyruvate dioxygenase [Neokomagataea thailandica NBRC 106555]